ncbi:MAG TPA: DUF4870 domain-containing protein [Panacibacter sp.]|nr:DUF4870 domain-containing protein [Panacibacter sp.]HNP46649.1 DUF4870 domain-containing protein [Panacibacter sp.]
MKINIMADSSFTGNESTPDYVPTSDEKTLALLSHILTFIAPFIAPLIIYLVKKDESKFIAAHAKESLNFQITVIIICIVLFITVIGILLLWAIGLIASVLVIVATIKASEGKLYRYPFSLRLIK